MSAPQSLQNLATGVGTLHTGQGIIGSAESCVGTVLFGGVAAAGAIAGT